MKEMTYKQHREMEAKDWPKPNCKMKMCCTAYLSNKSYYQCQKCKYNLNLMPILTGMPVDEDAC